MAKPLSFVSTQSLKSMGVKPNESNIFKEPLKAACALYGIDTPARVAMFLAQAAHESAKFTRLQENLNYTSPERIVAVFPSRVNTLDEAKKLVQNPQDLANRVYSGRLGNGDTASGDGWKFRGRGLFQLTGRENYAKASAALKVDLVADPDLVALPEHAALTAAWFWQANGCNELADQRLFQKITRTINGPAMLGHTERMALYTQAVNSLD